MSLSPQTSPHNRRANVAVVLGAVGVLGAGVALMRTGAGPTNAPQTLPAAQGTAQTSAQGSAGAWTPPTLTADRALRSASGYPFLPDPRLTPGAVLTTDMAKIDQRGYSATVRDEPAEVKRAAFARYGFTRKPGQKWEADHLIPLSLGGSNTNDPSKPDYLFNLWPETAERPWGFPVKDRLEIWHLEAVRQGRETLAQAQTELRTDWIASYRAHIGTEPKP
jgi:hypothetical protein